jgi:hypothetical protein
MKMNDMLSTTPNPQQSLVLSYLGLRKGIGIIGLALPLVLLFGRIIFESHGILDTISAYYYSVMRDIFVGSLWAIGIFLISYRYASLDDILGDLAGLFAILVSIFPTTDPDKKPTELQMTSGLAHLVFAACFLIILAIFALYLFREENPDGPTPKKRQRNRVYFICGIAIFACLVLIILVQFLPSNSWLQSIHPRFWLESLAIWAFGIAWFVKGEGVGPLNDPE